MDLNAAGSLASLLGLVITFYTLVKVTKLSTALKRQSIGKQLSELVDDLDKLEGSKKILIGSKVSDVHVHIKTVRLYYLSGFTAGRWQLKSLIANLEGELAGPRRISDIRHWLVLILNEITIG